MREGLLQLSSPQSAFNATTYNFFFKSYLPSPQIKDVTVNRTLKGRREESKKLVTSFASIEERQQRDNKALTKAAGAATPRPPGPTSPPLRLQGDIFTKLLDLWEFLSSFSPVLAVKEIPTLEAMAAALQVTEPRMPVRAAMSATGPGGLIGPQSLAGCLEDLLALPTSKESADMLNAFGILLCEWVRHDYEKFMGIDVEKGMFRLPINVLTWREVAYMSLLHHSMRECAFNESDVQSSIKGKGLARTIAESLDTKALKLAKKRIEFQYSAQSEFQESVVGFGAGVVVRIPAPAGFFSSTPQVVWRTLVESLNHCPDSRGWIAIETIDAAIRAVQGSNREVVARIKSDLRQCQSVPLYKPEQCGLCKAAAQATLRWDPWSSKSCAQQEKEFASPSPVKAAALMSSSLVAAASVSSLGGAEGMDVAPAPASDAFYFDQPPLTAFELADRQARFFTTTATTKPFVLRKDEDEDEDEEEEKEENEEDDEEKDKKGDEEEEEGKVRRRIRQNRVRSDLEKRVVLHHKGLVSNNPLDAIDEADEAAAALLPLAMLRCYYLICSLMRLAIATPFAFATPKSYSALYMHIPEPLSLMDIRRTLVEGGYNNQLTRFYADVMINFENAMAYNPEHTEMFRHAAKCIILFERMFLEMVLAWEHALPYSTCCNICRDPTPIETQSTRATTCDRCEGCFHLHCLDPPLGRAPRKEDEWICPFCIEQRGVAALHPLKTSKVLAGGVEGEVVGIETVGNTLRFCVVLGNDREVWSGRQVRRGCLEYATSLDGMAVDDGFEMRDGVPVMPPGYNYDDYDAVAGYAVGYSGWGTSQFAINPYVNFSFSYAARRKSQVDPLFEGVRRSIGVLSTQAPPHIPGAAEWATVLRAMISRVASGVYGSQATSSPIFAAFHETEEPEDHYKLKFRNAYAASKMEYDQLIRAVATPQTSRLVLMGRLEQETEDRNKEAARLRSLTRASGGRAGIADKPDTVPPPRCDGYVSDATTVSDL